jgi:hypothetical protein
MTFHLRDIVRLFRGFGAATEGQVLSYNEETQRPEWRDAVGDEVGGVSPLRVVKLDSSVDITENAEWTDLLTASVEASSTYYVEGYIRGIDAVAVDFILSYPSGASWCGVFTISSTELGGGIGGYWDGARLTATYFGSGNVGIKFSGVLTVASTAGDFKLRAAQAIEDPTTTEITTDTYITITKAQ